MFYRNLKLFEFTINLKVKFFNLFFRNKNISSFPEVIYFIHKFLILCLTNFSLVSCQFIISAKLINHFKHIIFPESAISFKNIILITLAFCFRFFLFSISINITNLGVKQTALIKGFSDTAIAGKRTGRGRTGNGSLQIGSRRNTFPGIHQIGIKSSIKKALLLCRRQVILILHIPKFNVIVILPIIHILREFTVTSIFFFLSIIRKDRANSSETTGN